MAVRLNPAQSTRDRNRRSMMSDHTDSIEENKMTRQTVVFAAILVGTVLGVAGRPARAADLQAMCRPYDRDGAGTAFGITWNLRSRNARYLTALANMGLYPADTSAVILISDEALCRRASVASESVDGSPESFRPVYLFRVGNQYVVDYVIAAGGSHYKPVFVFDTTWTYRGALGISVGLNSAGQYKPLP